MKNQYRNYRIALLKSKVCFVANCMEETDPQRDKLTFIFFFTSVYLGQKGRGKCWVLLQCCWGYQEKDQIVAIQSKTSLTVTCVPRQPQGVISLRWLCTQKPGCLGHAPASDNLQAGGYPSLPLPRGCGGLRLILTGALTFFSEKRTSSFSML